MATSIDSNPFPLGFVSGTPGSPVLLTANIPDFDCPYVNLIMIQAAPGNSGRCYLGNASLDVATGAGVIYAFMVPGDSLVLSSFAQNVYRISDFRLDFEKPGDGVYVSVYVR